MKKIFPILAFFALLSCAKPSDEILIGEFGSLTGGTATFGRSTHEGIMLAAGEINDSGGLLGKKVKIITEDDRSLSEEAKTAVLKLIKQHRVIALIGEVASSRSIAAAPEAEKSHVPMISPASTNPMVTKLGSYIFRACFVDSFQGGAMARFARQDLGLENVAILKDIKNDYSVGLAEFFEKIFVKEGGAIPAVSAYSEGDIEFRAQLTNILSKNPDGIFIPGYYTEVGLIGRQARELGFAGPLLGGDGWDSSKTVEIGGDAMNGTYFSTHYSAEDPNPVVRNFIKKFVSKYNHVPDAMAVLGYDAAHILFSAIKRAGSKEGEKIRDSLADTKNFQGVSGLVTINADRNAEKSLVVMKIDGGRMKFEKTIPPS